MEKTTTTSNACPSSAAVSSPPSATSPPPPPSQQQQQPAAAAAAVHPSVESDERQFRNALFKRLDDRQLKTLLRAVDTGGVDAAECVAVRPFLFTDPAVVCCRLWRWPDLRTAEQLKHTPGCQTATKQPDLVCCNPYHWSKRCEIGESRVCLVLISFFVTRMIIRVYANLQVYTNSLAYDRQYVRPPGGGLINDISRFSYREQGHACKSIASAFLRNCMVNK